MRDLSLAMLPMHSRVGKEIITSLSVQIVQSVKLTHLDVSNCAIPAKSMLELMKAVKHSKTLHCIHLTGNPIDNTHHLKIYDILKIEDVRERAQGEVFDLLVDISSLNHIKNFSQQKKKIQQQSHVVYERLLGHYEMPGFYKWRERQNCRQCDTWAFLLVIWSVKIDARLEFTPLPAI